LNARTTLSLAIVLTRSQVRGTQRNRFLTRIFGEPRIILPVDIALLCGLGAAGYLFLSTRVGDILRESILQVEPQALAGIPSAIMFMAIVFGVLYEISQPIQSLSTDLLNWLPVTPLEYVGASTISETYIYSFVLCTLLGLVLGPAIALGMMRVWLAAAFMATVALFVGACVVEVLDATTNRISSSFYRKSGRSGILFRLVATVILLVLIQLLFSGYVINYILQTMIKAASVAWFVPVVWPTLAVLGLSQGNAHSFLVFSSLSVIFAAALFAISVQFRARFWVPVPVSIRLSSGVYRPGTFHLPFIGATESAMIQKDVRSLTRRREMARFLAIPFVLAISMGISLLPLGSQQTPEGPGFLSIVTLYILPVAIFVAALSMTSIGQEGYAIWNLYAAPIKASQLLRAKLLFAAALGLAFGVALLSVFTVLVNAVAAYYWILLMIGAVIVLEVSALGVYFAARFPDFREIRSRYASVWGSALGISVAVIVGILTASPTIISMMLYGSIIPELTIASLLIAIVVFVIGWKLALHQIEALFQNLRT
jgi:hypothetical protein